MSILRSPSVPLYRNPLFRPALEAVGAYLELRDYSQYACERIIAYAAVNGTPTGCEYLDHPADEAGATEAFVGALPPVALGSEAWDPEGVFLDAESILEAAGRRRIPRDAVLVPPELDDLDDPTALPAGAGLAPIAGGAPGPFEPSPSDWADYAEWSRTLEVRRWYDAHPISEFNAIRPD
jgi:hypothetical protein